MPIVLLPSMQTQIKRSSNQYWALCWRITLVTIANRVYRFTDASESLFFPDGEKFLSPDGMDGSAQRRRDKFRGVDRDFRGVISDSQITDEDLQRGIFKDAYIEEYLVDTRLAGIGPINVTQYWVRSVTFDGAEWTFEVDGTTSQFRQPVGDYWGKTCRVEVFSQGSGKCNVSEFGFRTNESVGTIVSDRSQFELFALPPTLWQEDNYGQDGWCTFVTGQNAGHTARIKRYQFNTPTTIITLQTRTPFPITVLDIVELLPGCNKRLGSGGHCFEKFNNVINYQGEPYIPGGDATQKGASLR